MVVLRLAKLIEMALATHDLTANQFRALAFAQDGRADLREMSVRLVTKRPNLTKLIDGLETRGLVTRVRVPTDRRRVALSLTDDGRTVLGAASAEADRALAGLAELGTGDPQDRLDALGAWTSTVEEAASLLRAMSA